jgi:hypothetical protein
VARDAIARQYDVDKNRMQQNKTIITFFAKKGKSVDLAKMFASLRATRMGDVGETGNHLRSLDLTVRGELVSGDRGPLLKVTGTTQQMVLSGEPAVVKQLRAAAAGGPGTVTVTGRVQGWAGHFPKFLGKPMPAPPTLLVTELQTGKK